MNQYNRQAPAPAPASGLATTNPRTFALSIGGVDHVFQFSLQKSTTNFNKPTEGFPITSHAFVMQWGAQSVEIKVSALPEDSYAAQISRASSAPNPAAAAAAYVGIPSTNRPGDNSNFNYRAATENPSVGTKRSFGASTNQPARSRPKREHIEGYTVPGNYPKHKCWCGLKMVAFRTKKDNGNHAAGSVCYECPEGACDCYVYEDNWVNLWRTNPEKAGTLAFFEVGGEPFDNFPTDQDF